MIRFVDAALVERNDEWGAQSPRYVALGAIVAMDDDEPVRQTDVGL